MDKLNNITTGDNRGRNFSPRPGTNPFSDGDGGGGGYNSGSGSGGLPHPNEQPVDSLRREHFDKITTDHDAGAAGNHRQQVSDGPYSNESASSRSNDPAAGTAKATARTTSTTSVLNSKWLEWAHHSSSLSGKPGVEPDSSLRETSHAVTHAEVAQDEPNQSSPPPSSLKQLTKMIKSHYLISIVCLILVIVACLLASVVISRSIGDPDLEVDTTKDSGHQLKESLVDPLELRTIELVDLMECAKTFAYIRWQVQVRVPKSSATYKQHLLVAPAASNDNPRPFEARQKETQSGLPDLAKEANDSSNQVQNHNSEHQLASRSDSIAESFPTNVHNTTTQPIDNKKNVLIDQQQVPNESGHKVVPADGIDLNLAAVAVDPLEFAANEMSIKLNDMNSTIVDCFLVDVEKRPEQKLAIERRHNEEALTRRVDFKSMLTMIQGCRSLTLASLANKTIQDQRETPVKPSQLLEVLPALAPSSPDGVVMNEPKTSGTSVRDLPPLIGQQTQLADNRQIRALTVPIKPVERPLTRQTREQQRPRTSDNNNNNSNPFVSLLDTLIATLSNPSVAPRSGQPAAELQTTRKNVPPSPVLAPSEPRQAGSPPATPLPVPKSTATNEAPLDDEAQRASYVTMGMSMMSGIVPNTLWCGLGDRAKNYSELGSEFQVDACCRAHDHCPIRLKPFSADYQLINWSMSTRSHCDCDQDFNDCLTALNSTLSNVIKVLYFRFVGLQCIDLEGRKQNAIVPTQ